MQRMLIYVDLLGFKNRVRTTPLDNVIRILRDLLYSVYVGVIRYAVRSGEPLETLTQLPACSPEGPTLALVLDELRKRTALSVLLMSDSLVLYSDPVATDEPTFTQQLTSLVLLGRTLMLELFELQLP